MANLDEQYKKSTLDKPLGLLVNGVELYPPSIFNESLYFGSLSDVKILNKGDNYDLVNPSDLNVVDNIGEGKDAIVHGNLKGKLKEVLVISPGIGYERKPTLTLVGGNLKGSIKLETNLVKKPLSSPFYPNSVGVSNTTITFINDHNFENGEEVVYNSNKLPSVVGLVTNSSYFIGIVASDKISLYKNRIDALNKENYIDNLSTISGVNVGIQYFTTVDSKNLIDKVYIDNFEGDLYRKIVKISSTLYPNSQNLNGIDIQNDIIYAKNHNFNEKDLIVYSSSGSVISGLNTTKKYYVTVLDSDSFKLSDAGAGNIPNEDDYFNKVYVSLNSVGSGNHIFKYPDIKVIVSVVPGITSTTPPVLEPVVLGSYESIFIENYGVGYGISEVTNIQLFPDVRVKGFKNNNTDFRSEAVFNPVIVDGKIVDVVVLNTGDNYTNDIDIIIEGEGKYAKLYPIIEDKKIIKLKVLEQGSGYNSKNTLIYAKKRGVGAKFLATITKWTINQYFKYKNLFNSNDNNGFVIPSRNIKNSLQFINIIPPNNLRGLLNDSGETVSPILGWAYDGNPIFGSYIIKNNSIQKISSSYKLNPLNSSLSNTSRRPPFSKFPNGYFIEDYQYLDSQSELDEYNGMFVTDRDEFPNGTYGYFMTSEYPYLIGPSFKNVPYDDNFDAQVNQNIKLENNNLVKNTAPLYLTSPNSGYDPIKVINEKYKQDVIVKNVLGSNVEYFNIINSGSGYKIGDRIKFSTQDEQDIDLKATVSRLNGKNILTINVGITSINDILFKNQNNKIIGYSSTPHYINNDDYIYIKDSDEIKLIGDEKVKVAQKTVNLLSNTDSNGITTYIQVDDIFGFQVDDYIKIDNEIASIIEILPEQSKFYINRLENIESHTSGISSVTLLPTRFEFDNKNIKTKLSITNKKYFNPRYSVGIGTTNTLINNFETYSTYYVPTQSIYIPNHNYKTNQKLIYNKSQDYDGLLVSNTPTSTPYRLNDGQVVYAVNLGVDRLGISTVSSSSTSLTFRESSYNSDEVHSFNFIGTSFTGNIESFNVEINTSSNHQLETNDVISLHSVENTWDYYAIKFDLNQRYNISVIDLDTFKFNVKKPSYIKYAEQNSIAPGVLNPFNVSYSTNSVSASGGIHNIRLDYLNVSYEEVPSISSIETENGKGAVIIPISKKIGKIDTVERVKDGFDYPSDSTLRPRLGTNVICYITDNQQISKVNVLNGGLRYNYPPTLKVVGNDDIVLKAKIKNYSVSGVTIEKNANNLSEPLTIIPVNNSNGYDILDIYKVSSTVNRIVVDITNFPLIYSDYNDPVVDFPFKIGDLIFIENCKIAESNKINYNSVDNNDSFYEVVGVNTSLGRIDYQISNEDFGTYQYSSGYGSVINKNSLASFEMEILPCDFIPGERVYSLDSFNNIKFSGNVLDKNGWDKNKNELKLTKFIGYLEPGDTLISELSSLRVSVIFLNNFRVKTKLGSSRYKINYKNNYFDLNSDLKKLQDGNYYQDFSYSIKGKTPYEEWREPVKSIVHPSGFKEFSDLQVYSKPSNKLNINVPNDIYSVNIKIENENSLFTKTNYTIGYDREKISKNTTERVYFGSGSEEWPVAVYGPRYVPGLTLLPYILNKSNNVIDLKLIPNFDGSYDYINLGNRNFTFDSEDRNYLGVSTTGLLVGDKIGYSSYFEYPTETKIISIGQHKVEILHPHKVYDGSIIENLEIIRTLDQNKIVGISSFKIVSSDDKEVYKISCKSLESKISISKNSISIPHIFESGQLIKYENSQGERIGIKTTTQVIGGISTDKLPSSLYVIKVSNNSFKLAGLSDLTPLNITSIGEGTHIFTFENPNSSTLISIDNIIQSPLYSANINLPLSSNVGINSTVIYVSSGITSITTSNILKIENEYLRIKSLELTSPNSIEVERGYLGSIVANHSGIQTTNVYKGNYLINDDIIYFTSPPFGPSGLKDIEISSKFNGRLFSRTFSSERPNDKNLILDDISNEFVGLSSFTLTENGNNVVGLYTNTNDQNSTDINNNPLIFINNIAQVVNSTFDIINPESNKILFLDETPKIGKIIKYSSNEGFGYVPLVAAAATVSVSIAGTISNVYLTGPGSGYRTPPNIEIVSQSGYGASITATIGASGTITSLSVTSPGNGYNQNNIPEIIIDEPIPYYNLSLKYDSSSNGIGTDAKVSLTVDDDSKIKNIEFLESGFNYKVGDVLNVVGLTTNPNAGSSFDEFKITVDEVISDSFAGLYPGQFLQFEDISNQFNSVKTEFDLITVINGKRSKITFKNSNPNIKVEENLLVFINDILQVPFESYRFIDGTLILSEPPMEESTCNILYYQGSQYDVELIIPRQTIKNGDTIKLEDNELIRTDSEQEERVVKRLISSNTLDTFPYSGFGINPYVVKPISWTKQKNDRIINGSLVSKSREDNSARVYPTAKMIWNFDSESESLYVDNAYPLFVELDNSIGQIVEGKRNVRIINNKLFESAEFEVNVSTSSTISSIDVLNSGSNYSSDAKVTISTPQPGQNDPLYQFNSVSGINTSYAFNSIIKGDILVSVGNSNLVAISTDLINWSFDNLDIELNVNLNKIAISTEKSYVSVGSSGKIFLKETKDSPWTLCGIKTELYAGIIFQGLEDSTYTGTFNDVIYNENLNIWAVVGDQGKIYRANDVYPSEFIEAISQNFDYKSVAYNSDVFVAVGIGGISTSVDGINWINAKKSGNYYSVIWDNDRFITSSDNTIYYSKNNGKTWTQISLDSPITLNKITKYNEIYIGINNNGDLYTSYDLKNWLYRTKPTNEFINEIQSIKYSTNDYLISVGTAGTIFYSSPTIHKASLIPNITNGELLSIDVVDGGFGYSDLYPPVILIETPKNEIEILKSIKAIGDYGKIVGIKTSNTGIGTNSPRIDFEIVSDYSEDGYDSLNTYGITYSNLTTGDYFIIQNSNVGTVAGYALTGITTHLGGMSNYPESKVGTATSYLDGVYRVDYVQSTNTPQGIVTVTCHFVPVNGGISINTSGVTTSYYGNYSWSKIFDFDSRDLNEALSFNVNPNNSLTGLSTSPTINRIPPLLF